MRDYEFEHLDKLTVATRQLREAVDMLFSERDRIAIHTVASAAHQVFADLAIKRNLRHLLRNPSAYIDSSAYTQARKELCEPENFFKHADRDADAQVTFAPLLLQIFLVESIEIHAQLAEHTLWDFHVFNMWFHLCFPGYTHDKAFSASIESARETLPDLSDATSWLNLLRAKSGESTSSDPPNRK